MPEYDEKLNSFKNRINAAPTLAPLQEVRQLELKTKDEAQLNVWVSKQVLHDLKLKGLNINMSLKQMVHAALENYLELAP